MNLTIRHVKNNLHGNEFVIAVLAKAPIPGFAKTRLIPAFNPVTAARIHRALTLQTLATACAANSASISLWCAPNPAQRFFRAVKKSAIFATKVDLHQQADGDLGQRMAAVFAAAFAATARPLILIGTDCPAITKVHLHKAAKALADGDDAVFIPAEDGGYALVGLRRPVPEIFNGIAWGGAQVMAQTRERLTQQNLQWCELETLWDVDLPADVIRWREMQRIETASVAQTDD